MYKYLIISFFFIITAQVLFAQPSNTSNNLTFSYETIKMDKHFDSLPCDKAIAVLKPYKKLNDSIMSVIIGQSNEEMTKSSPQSLLSNLSADLLFLSAKKILKERVDFSLFNMGGIRGDMPKGAVTKGDIYGIYSFDNQLVILEIQGKYLRELFHFFTTKEVQAIGGNIQLIYNNHQTFQKAIIRNKPLDDHKTYKVITVDFLASGGDNMTMLTHATSMKTFDLTLRDVVLHFFEKNQKKGIPITSQLDQRVVFENQ